MTTSKTTDNGHILIRKAHVSLRLRRAIKDNGLEELKQYSTGKIPAINFFTHCSEFIKKKIDSVRQKNESRAIK